MKREPCVAGQFYPDSADKLKAMVEKFLKKKDRIEVIAAVVPHAGYIYSGAVAGEVFSVMELADTYVIAGPNHSGAGSGAGIMTAGVWAVPTGDVEIDSEVAGLVKENSRVLKEDKLAHASEHSIEVQLPFIIQINPDAKIVPISLYDYSLETVNDISNAIIKALQEFDKRIVFLASSDFTHYQPHQTALEKDRIAIEYITKFDFEGLSKVIQQKDISMCGLGPIGIAMMISKRLNYNKVEVIDHKTSGDTSGDYSYVVGYAGIIFRK